MCGFTEGEERGDDGDADQAEEGQREGGGERGLAANPTLQALEASGRTRLDRLAVDEPLQVVGQGGGAAITPGRLFLQALEADGFQVARHSGVARPRRRRRLV